MIRSPIICVLGHVDHGKTTLLDYIRGTAVASKEPGLITQHVGASFIPTSVILEKTKALQKKFAFQLRIPGLLFIDTPGHEAFFTLRKRGGSIADLAVLVIDIKQGIQPQTVESIEILKNCKTPFVVALNKIDLINGWIPNPGASFLETIEKQREDVKARFEELLYTVVGQLAEHGFDSERFDRVSDFTKQVVIIPVSAKTGEGIPELLLFLAGLSQKYLEKRLEIHEEEGAKGVVLEVKETKGLGVTVDAIIYDGVLWKGDQIAMLTKSGVKIFKIRALLEPEPLKEMRVSRGFRRVEKVVAAAGVKIVAPGLEEVIAGSPLRAVKTGKEIEEIKEEVAEIQFEKSIDGVVAKADALGSLEGLISLLSKNNIPVRRAEVGEITKRDVIEAQSVREKSRYLGVIFGFNVPITEEAKEEAKKLGVPVFISPVIYKLLEDYEEWRKLEREKEKKEKMEAYIYPAKMKILEGCIFRISKPAIVGVEILEGKIKPGYPLMRADGKVIGRIVSIQEKGKSLERAEKGAKVAIAIEGCVCGRHIREKDILYTAVPLTHIYELYDQIEEKELLDEIKKIVEEGRK